VVLRALSWIVTMLAAWPAFRALGWRRSALLALVTAVLVFIITSLLSGWAAAATFLVIAFVGARLVRPLIARPAEGR
jgi:hypothetical protein